MKSFNIHDAKTNLSKLINMAEKGEPFIIARAGKPVVKVEAVSDSVIHVPKRIGFMEGQISLPDDFDTMGAEEIELMFYGEALSDKKAAN